MRHLRSISVLALGALLGASGIAAAADIPLKALPPPVPLFVWTGAYGGVNVGYSWGSSQSTSDVPALGATYYEGVPHRGWEASVEGGYCYQPGRDRDSNFVACLEVRYDFPAERSTGTSLTLPDTTTIVNTTHIDPLLIGPHLGFTTNANSTLWYGAGGLAMGEVGGSASGTGPGGTSTANPPSTWATGWFIGAGVEQMLSSGWSVKVEYDYIRLGGAGITTPYVGTNTTLDPLRIIANATATVAGNPYDNVVTVGINYHLH